MPKYITQLTSVSNEKPQHINRRWELEYPKGELDLSSLADPIHLRGWMLFEPGDAVQVLVRTPSAEFSYALNEPRPDVIKSFLNEDPAFHPSLTCGFNVEIAVPQGEFDLGFCINGDVCWVGKVTIAEKPKVEEGEAGWLFLQNDHNSSIDQYTGLRLLSAEELNTWENYFDHIRTLSREIGFSSAFLLVPAKEFIFPNYYPFKRAAQTPVDQFLEKFQSTGNVVWPEQALREERELTYWKGDTHWTDYGAAVGAREVLSLFGFDRFERWEDIKYVIKPRLGDLGHKLIPRKMHRVPTAEFGAITDCKVFDNQIHNHGRIRIYESPNPESQSVCVLFGDSFSIGMVPWLIPFFRRFVFIHTAGSVDARILQAEKPTHALFQTNSRFIIAPAKYNFSIDRLLMGKLKALGEKERVLLQKELGKQHSPETRFYVDLMRKASEAAGLG